MWTFLSIYLIGVIVVLVIVLHSMYEHWYNGNPITLGDIIGVYILLPLFSWVTVIAIGIWYLYNNSDKIVIRGRNKEE